MDWAPASFIQGQQSLKMVFRKYFSKVEFYSKHSDYEILKIKNSVNKNFDYYSLDE